MSSLVQREEKMPFLQAVVRTVEKIYLASIQPFQCSGLKTIFEVPPEDAHRNVFLDLQISELLLTHLGAALGLVEPELSHPPREDSISWR